MAEINQSVARLWAELEELDTAARKGWIRVDRAKKKLARMAGLGRKKEIIVPISESHGVKIVNNFMGEEKAFARAFARKIEISKVTLKA